MSKETMNVMDYVREYMRAETDAVIEDVLSIIEAGHETTSAMSTVYAYMEECND